MKLKLGKYEPVPYPVAKKRALNCLARFSPRYASSVADHIWPGHPMSRQGAGGAANRILRKMEKEGLVGWKLAAPPSRTWGWFKTLKGEQEERGL